MDDHKPPMEIWAVPSHPTPGIRDWSQGTYRSGRSPARLGVKFIRADLAANASEALDVPHPLMRHMPTNETMRAKITDDPDIEVEAGRMHPEAPAQQTHFFACPRCGAPQKIAERHVPAPAAYRDVLDALKHAVHWHDQLQPHDIARFEAVIAKAETADPSP